MCVDEVRTWRIGEESLRPRGPVSSPRPRPDPLCSVILERLDPSPDSDRDRFLHDAYDAKWDRVRHKQKSACSPVYITKRKRPTLAAANVFGDAGSPSETVRERPEPLRERPDPRSDPEPPEPVVRKLSARAGCFFPMRDPSGTAARDPARETRPPVLLPVAARFVNEGEGSQ